MNYVDVDFRIYPKSLRAKFVYSFNSLRDAKNANFEFKDFRNLLFRIADECQLLSSFAEKREAVERRSIQIKNKFENLNNCLLLSGMRRDRHRPISLLEEKEEALVRVAFFFSDE
ncbi:MAG: hypothetical protein ACOCUF_00240 [Patescibacteria group bacterium]